MTSLIALPPIGTITHHPAAQEPTHAPISLVAHSQAFIQLPNIDDGTGIQQKITKLFKKTLKDWQILVEDRVGILRNILQEHPDQEEIIRPKLQQDLRLKEAYLELFRHFKESCDKTRPRERTIIALTDERGLVQGLCDYEMQETTERVRSVYIHTLFTAPWNLKMQSPVPATHLPLCTKGVGLAMFREAYRHGMREGATSIQLKPLENSESFYRDRLHMQETSNSAHGIRFLMAITDHIPQELT